MRRTATVVVCLGLLAAACSSDDKDAAVTTVATAETSPDTAADTTGNTAAVTTGDTTADTTDTTAATTAGTTGDSTADTSTDIAKKPWTVLVYSIADTNLEPYMMTDVGEMGEVGTTANLNMLALVDRAADYTDESVLGLGDWVGGKLIEIGQANAVELADVGNIDTGSQQVLSDFVTLGIQQYPAEHYALIISDHGASWPGVGGDESADGDGLTLAEIHDGLAQGLADAGVEKLDLLGFDACLMASYEVASALAPLADRMVASQELEPGHGWDYSTLAVLDAPDAVDADTLGEALIAGFQAQATTEGDEGEITLALLDLTKMGAVDDALSGFVDALEERGAEFAPVIGETRANNLGFGRSPDPSEDTQMTDLGLLAANIGIEALDVSDQADTLIRAINDVVVDSIDGMTTKGATGLSIYFPPESSLLDADYETVVKQSPWDGFLTSYYRAGAAIPADQLPVFLNAEGAADATFDADGLTLTGELDPGSIANLSDAVISYGIIEADGTITFIGEEPAVLPEDGSTTVTGFYDLTALTITDGQDTAYAYLELTIDAANNIATIDVPMAYYAPGENETATYSDVLLSLTLDATTFDVINETYYVYDEQLGSYGELTADPEAIIVPEQLNVDAAGNETWIPTSDVGLFADLPSLQYDIVPLPSGTQLYAQLTVTDFGGNSAYVSTGQVIP